MVKRKDSFLSEKDKLDLRMKLHVGIPPCFNDSEEYYRWKHSGITASPDPVNSYCEDCAPEYKQKMMDQKRCTWPCVEFYIDSDGMLSGRRKSLKELSSSQISWLSR